MGGTSWVLEISSFQSELLTAMAPTAAVFLNLSQDHLERHAGLDEYLAAKRRLFAFQNAGDTAILNADDPASAGTETRRHGDSSPSSGRPTRGSMVTG